MLARWLKRRLGGAEEEPPHLWHTVAPYPSVQVSRVCLNDRICKDECAGALEGAGDTEYFSIFV